MKAAAPDCDIPLMCSLKPRSKASFLGPVFTFKQIFLFLGDCALLSFCLLSLVIIQSNFSHFTQELGNSARAFKIYGFSSTAGKNIGRSKRIRSISTSPNKAFLLEKGYRPLKGIAPDLDPFQVCELCCSQGFDDVDCNLAIVSNEINC